MSSRAELSEARVLAVSSAHPAPETGYDLAVSHPNIFAWTKRIAAMPGWRAPYDLMPGCVSAPAAESR